jgi:S-adenosylmethionine synthetase
MFSSESVTEGHPDKLCDQISDAIIDHFLVQDPLSRVVAECAVATGVLFIAARYDSHSTIDIAQVARGVIEQVGYRDPSFNAETCSVMQSLRALPAGRQDAVDEGTLCDAEIEAIPAGNQVTVFGFACRQNAAFMPLPIWLAHKLARRLTELRVSGQLPYLGPDGKTQVGVEYRQGQPVRIHSITIIASQAEAGSPSPARLRDDLIASAIAPVFLDEDIEPDPSTQVFINPVGPFEVGGPAVHAGLTGRKSDVDTYGEYARHSGSALSGKGPLRIDRTGAYAARYAAKNVVVAGLADECEVQLSYCVGLSRPVSLHVHTFGTGRLPDAEIAARVERCFEFRPAGIVREFELRRLPASHHGRFYARLAAYGHMGRVDIGPPWERTDKAEVLSQGGW